MCLKLFIDLFQFNWKTAIRKYLIRMFQRWLFPYEKTFQLSWKPLEIWLSDPSSITWYTWLKDTVLSHLFYRFVLDSLVTGSQKFDWKSIKTSWQLVVVGRENTVIYFHCKVISTHTHTHMNLTQSLYIPLFSIIAMFLQGSSCWVSSTVSTRSHDNPRESGG